MGREKKRQPNKIYPEFQAASAPPLELYSPRHPAFAPAGLAFHAAFAQQPTPPIYAPPTHGEWYSYGADDEYESVEDARRGGGATGLRPARFRPKLDKDGKPRRQKGDNPMMSTRRGCTDVCCCFLFLAFIVGWAVVAVLGFTMGNPERLIHPTDSLGRRCGIDRPGAYNLSSKPYLFFFDLTKCISYSTVFAGCQTPQVCVEQCPTEYFSYLQMRGSFDQQKIHKNIICADDVEKTSITDFSRLTSLVQQKKCTAYTVRSAPVLGRCVPQALIGAVNTVNSIQSNQSLSLDVLIHNFGDDPDNIPTDLKLNGSAKSISSMMNDDSVVAKMAHDLAQSWWAILSLIIAAGVLAFVWTVVMRLLGSFMIWSSILLVVALLAAGTALCWLRWKALVDTGAIDDFSFQPSIGLYFEMPTTWMVLAVAISIITVIVLLVLLCVRKRITLAVAMIEESSRAIGNMMSTLVFPLFPFLLHILVFCVWGSVAIWLASSGDENCRVVAPNRDPIATASNPKCDCKTISQDPTCVYVNITRDSTKVFWLQAYNLFGFFWLSCFVTALGDISLAGAFASHYWALNKKTDVPTFPVLRALKTAIKYNLGSLAFGSLIIAIVKFIRAILEFLENRLEKAENKALKCLFTGLKCFFWCLEAFLKFLTKNAYIMMAIYGRGFYTSAKDSFLLLARNVVRVVVINKVAGFLLFIGKAVISLGTGAISYMYFAGHWRVEELPTISLHYTLLPVIIVLIGSYWMADLFFDVYEMAVETTFICFLEDSEENDGSAEKPYFMSNNLLQILGKHNEPVAQG